MHEMSALRIRCERPHAERKEIYNKKKDDLNDAGASELRLVINYFIRSHLQNMLTKAPIRDEREEANYRSDETKLAVRLWLQDPDQNEHQAELQEVAEEVKAGDPKHA